MSSGKTHDRITFLSLPLIALPTSAITDSSNLTLIVSGGFLFSGLMFGPDLDIYSIQYQRWGHLRWLWLPYQKLLPHRSVWSHGPAIGTTLRLLYFLGAVMVLAVIPLTLAQLIWGLVWEGLPQTLIQLVWQNYRQEAIALVIGLELGAMSHSLADWLSSRSKSYGENRARKKKRRKIGNNKIKKK
jgi:uncharacterized metal-binding protein